VSGTSAPGPSTAGSSAAGTTSSSAGDSRSLGQIVSDVSSDLSTLFRQELELAKTELKEEAGRAGKGVGMLGGAGVAGHFVLFFASFALLLLLDRWMAAGLAALIVAVLWGVVAAVLASMGRKALKEANPQLPKTQQTLKEDAQWAKAQKS
jgi:uncharacterized membrane protein YqjE